MTENNNQQLVKIEQQHTVPSLFTDMKLFDDVQRMAQFLSSSALVPDAFRNNQPNCVIAIEMARMLEISPLVVMQNMYIVHGKPAWSSKYLIGGLNRSGRFSHIDYDPIGEKGTDSYGLVAWAYDRTGKRVEGPEVTIGMAKKEGWYGKNGSKWQTMPELMLRYRAATFFINTYCPEISMGMQTDDEVIDITDAVVENPPQTQKQSRFARKEKAQQVQQTQQQTQTAKAVNDDGAHVQDAEVVDAQPAEETPFNQAVPYDADAEARFKDLPCTINDMLDWYKAGGYPIEKFNGWVKTVDLSKFVGKALDMKEGK